MSETSAIFRFRASSVETSKRILLYLNGDTRPDFDDEVPESEKSLFEVMEFAAIPLRLKQGDDHTVFAWFEFIQLEEVNTILKSFDAIPGIENRHAYFADDEEFRAYFEFSDNRLKLLYEIEQENDIDEILWSMDWDESALDWIIQKTTS
jgi:hypothetical protein